MGNRHRDLLGSFALAAVLAAGLGPTALAQLPNARLNVMAGTEVTPGANNVPLLFVELGDAAELGAFDFVGQADIWRLSFRGPPATSCSAPAPVIEATPTNCTFTSFAFTPALPGSFQAVWSGGHHASMPAGTSFTVTVSGVAAAGSNVYELDIVVNTNAPTLCLTEVEFPRLNIYSRGQALGGGSADELLTLPVSQGVVVRDPVNDLHPFPIPFGHPGELSMQWLTYYVAGVEDGPVLFFGSRDPVGYAKEYRIGPEGTGTFNLSIVHLPEGDTVPDNDYGSPYPSVLGLVRGDWHSGADEYRQWLFSQPSGSRPVWLTKTGGAYLPPLAARSPTSAADRPLPAQLLDAEMIWTIHGMKDPANWQNWHTDVADQQSYYGVSNTPSVLYRWHDWYSSSLAYPDGIGEWTVLNSGFAAELPHSASPWAPYMSLEAYDTQVPSYANTYVPGFSGSVGQFVQRRYDQCIVALDEANQPPRFPRLCNAAVNGSGQRFAGELAKYVGALTQALGSRSMYLDEASALGGFPCYDATHGHPVGAGSYMTAARRATMDDLRATMAVTDPEYFVSSEAPSEVFVDVLQLAFEHAYPDLLPGSYRSAPLFASVYRDYQLTGRILFVSNNPGSLFGMRQLRRAVAYAQWFGDIPTGGSRLEATPLSDNLGDPDWVRTATMLKSSIDVSKQPGVRPFLHLGRRLRDPVHTAPRIPEQDDDNVYCKGYVDQSGDQPVCYVSAWADAAAPNRFAVAFANWTWAGETFDYTSTVGGAQVFDVTIDPAKLGVAPGNYDVHWVTDQGDAFIGTIPFTGPLTVTMNVPPLSALVVYLTKV